MRLQVRRVAVELSLAALLLTGACGEKVAALPLRKVPANLAPTQIAGATGDIALNVSEYTDGSERLAGAVSRSMISDGRVWAIRRGSTLVGALQISTLRPRVDVGDPKERDKLAGLVLSGSVQKITVSGVEVIAARTTDKIVFLWFGDQLFEVMQVKGVDIVPAAMLKSVIDFQKPTGELRIKAKS